jgi:hypothetical protein
MSQFSLKLTTPAEKSRSVKCAVSWLKKNSPREFVRYAYLNIPNAFEMNPDPLLMGISNKDLDWTATQVENGVKSIGKKYPAVNELIAPYRIDWNMLTTAYDKKTAPMYRAKYQNDWFVKRDPALLRLNQGSGFWLVNQLLLQNDAVKGRRIGNLLLTGLGASVGSDIYVPGSFVVAALPGNNANSKNFLRAKILNVRANSSARTVKVSYTLPDNRELTGTVVASLFNISGRQIATVTSSRNFSAGSNEIVLKHGNLSHGVYVIKLSMQKKDGDFQMLSRQVTICE